MVFMLVFLSAHYRMMWSASYFAGFSSPGLEEAGGYLQLGGDWGTSSLI